jgi:hypothetical protein
MTGCYRRTGLALDLQIPRLRQYAAHSRRKYAVRHCAQAERPGCIRTQQFWCSDSGWQSGEVLDCERSCMFRPSYRTDEVRHRGGAAGISTLQETCHIGSIGDSLNSELRGATNARRKIVEEQRSNSLRVTNVPLLTSSTGVDHLHPRSAKDRHTSKAMSYADWSTSSPIGQLVVAAGGVLALVERHVLGYCRQRKASTSDGESNCSNLHV